MHHDVRVKWALVLSGNALAFKTSWLVVVVQVDLRRRLKCLQGRARIGQAGRWAGVACRRAMSDDDGPGGRGCILFYLSSLFPPSLASIISLCDVRCRYNDSGTPVDEVDCLVKPFDVGLMTAICHLCVERWLDDRSQRWDEQACERVK